MVFFPFVLITIDASIFAISISSARIFSDSLIVIYSISLSKVNQTFVSFADFKLICIKFTNSRLLDDACPSTKLASILVALLAT